MSVSNREAIVREKKTLFVRIAEILDDHFEFIAVIPALIIVILVILVPTIIVIHDSFFIKDVIRRITKFVGFGNYVRALSGADENFWRYFSHSAIYVIFATSIGIALSLFVAVLLNSRIKLRGLFIAGFLLPWMVPPVTAAIMWKWMLNDSYGVLNYLLVITGVLEKMFPFFSNTISAWVWLIWVDIWYNSPFFIVILFAGLQRIPDEITEAAIIDGASRRKLFTHITIPYIKPEIQICLILRTMFVWRNFGFVYVFTRGGPVDATEVMATYTYKVSMHFLKQGYGSSLSVIIMIVTILITLIYFRILRGGVEV
jgi:multiple sugar transport system permease protein